MADFYSQFSKILPLDDKNPKELQWWQNLKELQGTQRHETSEDPQSLNFDFKITEQPPSIWLYCDHDGSDSETAAETVHQFLKHFDLPDVIELYVATWCSKPRVDEQGGHAHVIHKTGHHCVSLHQGVADLIRSLELDRKPLFPNTGPLVRTTEAIVARIHARRPEDVLSFEWPEYLEALSLEDARPFLHASYKEDPKKPWAIRYHSTDSVRKELIDYMSFAWDKANSGRGISACRSILHLVAWLWLLGPKYDQLRLILEDDLSMYYGKPFLRLVCEQFDVDWRALDNDRWTNDEHSGIPADQVTPLTLS